jgi:hypothetical protein
VVASRFERGWVVKWGRWASGSGRPCVSAGHPCEGKEGREGGEEEELHLREERTAARESYHRRQELSPLGESRHERAIVSRPPMELLDFHVYCAWIGSGSSEYSSLPNAVFFWSGIWAHERMGIHSVAWIRPESPSIPTYPNEASVVWLAIHAHRPSLVWLSSTWH